jgi:hypothetical protein
MFSMHRIATLVVIAAAAVVPTVGAQAADASNADASGRHASRASIHEPLGWQWSDMSG